MAIVAALLWQPSCAQMPAVGFTVILPSAISASATWIELGVFPGRCPGATELAGGIPPEGTISRVAFRRADVHPPAIGDLKKGPYAFAAVARGDDCSVLAAGCSVVDVTDSRSVEVDLTATQTPAGACSSGTQCVDALCVPNSNNSDPSLGQDCSLTLVGAGPLADSLAGEGTLVSAPAITATSVGFLIAYREFDPTQGVARLTLIPVDAGGGALLAQQTTLPGRCVQSEESDATSLAFAGDNGNVAVARAPCMGVGGLDLFDIDPMGNVQKSGFNAAGNARILLANAHALASTPAQDGLLLALTENAQALVTRATDVAVSGQPATPFGGSGPMSSAWVATTDQVIALLALGTDLGGGGGGADSGAEGGAPPTEAGTGGGVPSLRIRLASPNANLGTLPTPFIFPGAFAGIAAEGTRVFVVSDSPAASSPVGYRAFDLGKTDPVAAEGFAPQGLGPVLSADVALAKDRALFAIEQPGSISIVAYDHATTMPSLLRSIYLPDDARVPAMTNVRDGRVAIAANDTRVAVVWTTAKSLGSQDTTGGYAVYACSTP